MLSSLLLSALLAAPLGATSPAPKDGRDLAERFFARPRGTDGRMEMEIRLVDRKGHEKAMRLLSLRESAHGRDRTLLRFTAPSDIAGVGVLVRELAEGPSERLLFLPAVGKVRRVAPSRRDENFAGSDFSFEDIAGRRLDDYEYRLLEGTATIAGREAWGLELRPRDARPRFERSVWWIDCERTLLVRGEAFERGERARIFTGEEAERVDGIWLQRKLTMEDLKKAHRTIITIVAAAFGRGVDPSLLTETALASPPERTAGVR